MFALEFARRADDEIFSPEFDNAPWHGDILGGKDFFDVPGGNTIGTEPFLRKFEIDGFNHEKEIGFEYFSREDAELYDSMTDTYERSRLFIDTYEQPTLDHNMIVGSHAVKNFESGTRMNLDDERDYLIEQVDEFINWLKDEGKL